MKPQEKLAETFNFDVEVLLRKYSRPYNIKAYIAETLFCKFDVPTLSDDFINLVTNQIIKLIDEYAGTMPKQWPQYVDLSVTPPSGGKVSNVRWSKELLPEEIKRKRVDR